MSVIRLAARTSPSSVPYGTAARTVVVKLTARGAGGAVRPLNLGLLLDKSGSMVKDTPAGSPTKLDAAKAAAARVVGRLGDRDRFTLLAFNDQPEVLVDAAPVGPNRAAILEAVRRPTASSETHVSRALKAAFERMRPAVAPGVTSAVYLLTDGFAHDPEPSVAAARELHQAGLAVYAGGVGERYSHQFLDRLCADPVESGRFLVDHVPTENLDRLAVAFERYVGRRGHVAAANCRLTVEPVGPARLESGTAEEHALALTFRDNTAPVPDVPAGGESAFELRLSVVPDGAGQVRVARLVLRYDGPDGRPGEAAADVVLTIDRGAGAKPVPDKDVDDLVKRIMAVKMQSRADEAFARGDVQAGLGLVRGSTKVCAELGQPERAAELEELARKYETATPQQRDVLQKELRQSTKVYSEPAPPAGGGG